jgi:hypothetical protein
MTGLGVYEGHDGIRGLFGTHRYVPGTQIAVAVTEGDTLAVESLSISTFHWRGFDDTRWLDST